MDMTVSGEQHDTCSQTLSCWCGIKRFVSLTLFVAAVGILFCNIISRQDTKSTPTEPTIDKVNRDLCTAGLGGGTDCPPDECSDGEVTIISGGCCPVDRVTNDQTTCCPSVEQLTNDKGKCCKPNQLVDGDSCKCTNSDMDIDQSSNTCKCKPGLVIDEGTCKKNCSLGQVDVNGKCCPTDQAYQDNSICCPPNSHYDDGKCKCSSDLVLNEDGSACVPETIIPEPLPQPIKCPTGQVPNEDGDACVCTKPNMTIDPNTKECVCKSDTKKDRDGHCCPEDRFLATTKPCCPIGKVVSANRDACVSKPNDTARLENTTALWVLLAIIGAICIFLLVLFFTRSNDKAAQGVVGPQGGKEDPDSDREGHGEYQFEQGRDGEE